MKKWGISDWNMITNWLVVWNIFYFSMYWVSNHPNWRIHIFQRGGWNHQPAKNHEVSSNAPQISSLECRKAYGFSSQDLYCWAQISPRSFTWSVPSHHGGVDLSSDFSMGSVRNHGFNSRIVVPEIHRTNDSRPVASKTWWTWPDFWNISPVVPEASTGWFPWGSRGCFFEVIIASPWRCLAWRAWIWTYRSRWFSNWC